MKNFGLLAKPLTDMLKKGKIFVWTSSANQAFEVLKTALTSAPILTLPNFDKPFVAETDASDKGIGTVLQQDDHPIAYVSKALVPKNQGLSTCEKESLAILMAVDHWRPYLQSSEFIIRTDQKSLTHLDDQRLNSYWQQKALTKLMGLQYKICYKKGATNNAADALSRMTHDHTSDLMAVSVAQPMWLQDLQNSYEDNEQAQQLLSELAISSDQISYSLSQGVIRFQGKIWLGHSKKLQNQVLQALHSSPIGGHSGAWVTYTRLNKYFYWPHMKKLVQEYVAACTICQQAKTKRVHYLGLLQPLAVPAQAWQVITMDFIEGLPTSSSYNCILVVVDKFSKYSHFIKLTHPFTALKVAKLFMENIYKLHGMPLAIVSDRDRIFTSNLWQELFKLSGTQLRMSSAYHPQSDGQTERVNQSVEAFLRCFIHSCPAQWSQWLALAEYWYNTNWHSSLGKSPFEVLYGHEPRHFGISNVQTSDIPDLESWLEERKSMTTLLQQQLLRVQQRMKSQADKNRSERSFAVGDFVWLKLQPYVQSSVVARSNYKLSFRYFGPYQIESRIGSVAYRLKLPPNSSVHPVFHVSILKKAVGDTTNAITLPMLNNSLQVPEMVLDRRLKTKGHRVITQLLIKWAGCPVEMTTWEDEDLIKHQLPAETAWGQAVFEERGDVTGQAGTSVEGGKEVSVTGASQGRPERRKKPNVLLSGPEWSK